MLRFNQENLRRNGLILGQPIIDIFKLVCKEGGSGFAAQLLCDI